MVPRLRMGKRTSNMVPKLRMGKRGDSLRAYDEQLDDVFHEAKLIPETHDGMRAPGGPDPYDFWVRRNGVRWTRRI